MGKKEIRVSGRKEPVGLLKKSNRNSEVYGKTRDVGSQGLGKREELFQLRRKGSLKRRRTKKRKGQQLVRRGVKGKESAQGKGGKRYGRRTLTRGQLLPCSENHCMERGDVKDGRGKSDRLFEIEKEEGKEK